MSSDLYFYDTSPVFQNSSPDMVSSEGDLLFPDPFSPFCDSSTDFFSELSNAENNQIPFQNDQNPIQNSASLDKTNPDNILLSSSPPSHQLQSLSLYTSNGENLANGYRNFSGFEGFGVKIEECQMGFEYCFNQSKNQQLFMPHSYSGVENVAKLMQRSFSSNSFEAKPDLLFQPLLDSLLESTNYQNQSFSPPENSFFAGQMRRVCSTGDLQSIRAAHSTNKSYSSPLAAESSAAEEGNFKVGKYSAEERKDRISKYRAKRNQRNFTKTIKYACRKTLADNRPRIRGRFARNEETGEIPKAACSTRLEDDDDLWFDGMNVEEDDGGHNRRGREFVNCYDQTQFQYYNY